MNSPFESGECEFSVLPFVVRNSNSLLDLLLVFKSRKDKYLFIFLNNCFNPNFFSDNEL
jgi:hypothetical protein